jgi:hypothetical protein
MFAGIIVMMGVFNMIEQHTIGLLFLQNAQTIMKIVYLLIAYHSKAPEFTPVFSEIRIDCSIFSFLWCFAGHCLSLFLS